MRLATGFVLNEESGKVVFIAPFIWIILVDFVFRSTGKEIGDH